MIKAEALASDEDEASIRGVTDTCIRAERK